jgi:hypothetical protein
LVEFVIIARRVNEPGLEPSCNALLQGGPVRYCAWNVSTTARMDTSIRPIIGGADRRRHQRHTLSVKQQLVALTLAPGASVARLAREPGVNANQVFTWRKLSREGRLGPVDPTTPGSCRSLAEGCLRQTP